MTIPNLLAKPKEEVYQRIRMSYEEYLDWVDEDTRAEWSEGETIVHMPPKDRHQLIVEFVERLLALFVDLYDLGRVRIAPFEVKLWSDGPSREPDVFFVPQNNISAISDERMAGPPDLIVEVISPGSVQLDRNKKFREYEKAGVLEYWTIDSRPEHLRADFYRLDESGRYELFATEDDEVVHSATIEGFWLRPVWLWQEPSLNPLFAVAEIVGWEKLFKKLQAASSTTKSE